jgi:type 1 glutamine amidotransferase
VYRYARGPAENLTVLSHAKDPKTGILFPVEWTVSYGDGNVYNSTLGHVWRDQIEPEGVSCAGFQTLLRRGVKWLAGKDVGPVPVDFPTRDAPQMRPYPLK